ncbi:Protein of unknown function [Mycobacterium canettii CIPT 140070017]|nr:Protein of unknown function [Mycobacterium canettii CIPT 140070017]
MVAWESLEAQRDQIAKWVGDGLTVVKIGDLLARQGGDGAASHAAPVLCAAH